MQPLRHSGTYQGRPKSVAAHCPQTSKADNCCVIIEVEAGLAKCKVVFVFRNSGVKTFHAGVAGMSRRPGPIMAVDIPGNFQGTFLLFFLHVFFIHVFLSQIRLAGQL